MLLDYTTHEDVRALLGVEDDELENETLELHVFISGLESDLYDIDKELVETYKTISQKQEVDRTAVEGRVFSLTRAFATYSMARQLANSLPMFAPRAIADGKSTLTRFSGEPFKEVIKGIEDNYKLARSRLIAALEDLQSSTSTETVRPLLYVSTPSYDPVTGL